MCNVEWNEKCRFAGEFHWNENAFFLNASTIFSLKIPTWNAFLHQPKWNVWLSSTRIERLILVITIMGDWVILSYFDRRNNEVANKGIIQAKNYITSLLETWIKKREEHKTRKRKKEKYEYVMRSETKEKNTKQILSMSNKRNISYA